MRALAVRRAGPGSSALLLAAGVPAAAVAAAEASRAVVGVDLGRAPARAVHEVAAAGGAWRLVAAAGIPEIHGGLRGKAAVADGGIAQAAGRVFALGEIRSDCGSLRDFAPDRPAPAASAPAAYRDVSARPIDAPRPPGRGRRTHPHRAVDPTAQPQRRP